MDKTLHLSMYAYPDEHDGFDARLVVVSDGEATVKQTRELVRELAHALLAHADTLLRAGCGCEACEKWGCYGSPDCTRGGRA